MSGQHNWNGYPNNDGSWEAMLLAGDAQTDLTLVAVDL